MDKKRTGSLKHVSAKFKASLPDNVAGRGLFCVIVVRRKKVMPVLIDDIIQLPAGKRLELMSQIWDSLDQEPYAIDLTDIQIGELRRRAAEHDANPQSAIPWSDVKAAAEERLARW